jgi:uncharacterized membrane protein
MKTGVINRRKVSRLRGYFFRGIAVLIPFYFTIVVIRFLIETISTPLSYPIRWLFRLIAVDLRALPILENIIVVGTSLIITLSIIIIVGALVRWVVGRRIMTLFDVTFDRLPLVNIIYRTIKEFTRILTGDSVDKYKKVVMVSVPGSSGKTIGFVTGTMILEDSLPYLVVFVPTCPNISTGFLLFLPEHEVMETSLSTEDAFKVLVSIGILNRGTKDIQDLREE